MTNISPPETKTSHLMLFLMKILSIQELKWSFKNIIMSISTNSCIVPQRNTRSLVKNTLQ